MWEELQESDLPPPQEDMAKWEAEFNQLMTAQRDDPEVDYGTSMQETWKYDLGDLSEERLQFDDEGIPKLDPYSFGSSFSVCLYNHL